MNLDIIQSTKEGEITQFLCDVRDYFKASLTTSEYENTSNMFYVTAAETTEKLLNRCECLIKRLNIKTPEGPTNSLTSENSAWTNDNLIKNEKRHAQKGELEDVSYLDMSAAVTKQSTPTDNSVECKLNSEDNTKTFRCSTIVVNQNKSFLFERHDMMTTIATATTTDVEAELGEENLNRELRHQDSKIDSQLQIYDTCQISTQGSDDEDNGDKPKIITSTTYCSLPHIDCPYMDLPAGHLSIYKSTKFGQLQRIEKRLFFDQSKKCYCGILNDWLLCYVNGPTSNRPTISLYLKMPSIEVEHFGEGKRRDVCFQISTCDPNKKLVFQAINEIDAKEWIHAIETGIRSDASALDMKTSLVRKLPTPPVMKNIKFLSSFQRNYDTSNDGIYEEPSPFQQTRDLIEEQPPDLPNKLHNHSSVNIRYEYDVPKYPAQPLENFKKIDEHRQSDLNYLPTVVQQSSSIKSEENLDFQAKIKDVHSKLSSQLSNGPNSRKALKKPVTSSSLKNEGDISSTGFNLVASPVNELKKNNKLTPNTSPQKSSNEKTSFSKNWFLNKLNKSNSSIRSNSSSPSNSPSKCKQSEKENLLNSSSDTCDGYEMGDNNLGSNPASPILKTSAAKNATSKVNMIINQLEAKGHLVSMFSADTIASINSFCDNDYNNYEPIMTVSTLPTTDLIKKS